jgi:carotenoid 1,2-hydratase
VFSPYYARARRRGDADPANFCAVNAVLYGPRGKRWAMTERDRHALWRSESHLCIGRSTITDGGSELSLSIDETCVPLPFRLRGTVRLRSEIVGQQNYPIDPHGRNVWRPVMPSARIEVEMRDPELSWSGHGYADHNRGAAPLEQDFSRWTWARFPLREGNAILYDTIPRHGNPVSLALRYDKRGAVESFEPPPSVALQPTGWRVARELRSDAAHETTARTLEDTPFYARSVVTTQLLGERATGMHESLSLDRFASRWVQAMLPFRMPRRKGWRGRN